MKYFNIGSIMKVINRTIRVLSIVIVVSCIISNKTIASPEIQSSPSSFDCKVQPYYKYRKDGKPGREITLIFRGSKLYDSATRKVVCNSITEATVVNNPQGIDQLSVLLPFGAGVDKACQAHISVLTSTNELYRSVMVPVQRQWTVYIYTNSHVDIGYTNTQEFVRDLHVRNIDTAIDLAKKTQNYPEGSRFIWNPEATWVVDSYLKTATPEQKQAFIEAVRKGWICLDGNYFNINTSACSDEELLRLFHYSDEIQKITGVPIKTMVQVDVAGAAWGISQAAFQNKVHGFLNLPNLGTVRKPWEHQPFYWVSPDGKSRILFFQAFPYGYGWTIKGSKIGLGKIQGKNPDLDRISTNDPTVNFIDPLIFEETAKLEAANSPYNIFVLPWSLADNCLIDADLPDAVRLWNEKYAYPKLIIAGAQRILDDFENKYSAIIPEIKGDFTEYWTDGLGSDARRVGMNRHATENLVQMETAWSMLNYNVPSPRKLIDDSWQNCLLGVEHTWGYQDPNAPLAKQIEQTKASYFENSLKTSEDLLKETFKTIEKPESNKIAIFNTLSWDRDGLITLTKDQSKSGDRVINDKGEDVISQRLSGGELVFWAEKIPALGSKLYTLEKGESKKGPGCSINSNTLSNGVLLVTINPQTGDISSLSDIKTNQEYVDKKSKYGLNSYYYLLGKDSADQAKGSYDIVLKVKEKGPLVSSISVESKAPGCNWLTREVKIIYDQPWVDLTNSFDKISTRVKEGVHFGFPFNVPDGTTRMDIPWGIMIPEFDQLPAGNRNWLTFQHWVDISNDQTGITWTAIETPLIECGSLTANLRGGAHGSQNWYKTISKTQTIFSWALNNHWGTNFPLEQGGLINLHYGIFPHKSYDPVAANRFGLERNRPLIAIPVEKKPVTKSRVKIGNPRVFISMLKQSDDGKGMVLRLRSVSDKPERVLLSWTNGIPRKLYSCLANEKPGNSIKEDQTILPFGTISYYFEM
jgi:alpha-mannosidase